MCFYSTCISICLNSLRWTQFLNIIYTLPACRYIHTMNVYTNSGMAVSKVRSASNNTLFDYDYTGAPSSCPTPQCQPSSVRQRERDSTCLGWRTAGPEYLEGYLCTYPSTELAEDHHACLLREKGWKWEEAVSNEQRRACVCIYSMIPVCVCCMYVYVCVVYCVCVVHGVCVVLYMYHALILICIYILLCACCIYVGTREYNTVLIKDAWPYTARVWLESKLCTRVYTSGVYVKYFRHGKNQ